MSIIIQADILLENFDAVKPKSKAKKAESKVCLYVCMPLCNSPQADILLEDFDTKEAKKSVKV